MPAVGIPLSDPKIELDRSGHLLGPQSVLIVRTLGDLRNVFADEAARAAMPADTVAYRVECYYPVPEGTAGGLFFGTTFIEPGVVGDEYFMTKGHFHAKMDTAEYYWCIQGQGVLLLMDEQRNCHAQRMMPGSLHYIPGRTAHRVANTGAETLCFGACWPADAGHDYESIAARGFAARVLRVNQVPIVMTNAAEGAS
jgi:glucose-6-phosphate isomerase, archaeal